MNPNDHLGAGETPVPPTHKAEVIDRSEVVQDTGATGAIQTEQQVAITSQESVLEEATEPIVVVPNIEDITVLEGMKVLFNEKVALVPTQVVEMEQEDERPSSARH